MRKYYEISIAKMGKDIGSEDEYTLFDYQTKTCSTKEEVAEFLQKQYANCEGEEIEPGSWSYCFQNCDWSHAPVQWWDQEDLVNINEITATPVAL